MDTILGHFDKHGSIETLTKHASRILAIMDDMEFCDIWRVLNFTLNPEYGQLDDPGFCIISFIDCLVCSKESGWCLQLAWRRSTWSERGASIYFKEYNCTLSHCHGVRVLDQGGVHLPFLGVEWCSLIGHCPILDRCIENIIEHHSIV